MDYWANQPAAYPGGLTWRTNWKIAHRLLARISSERPLHFISQVVFRPIQTDPRTGSKLDPDQFSRRREPRYRLHQSGHLPSP